MSLRPNKTTHKALISTTSRFVGEYEKNGLLITHAWPSFYDQSILVRMSEGPASRSAFIFAFETPPAETGAGVAPLDYSPMSDLICSYLSILYGKRFDSHGLVEGSGLFHIPNLTQFNYLCDQYLPQNSHSPRVDFGIPLNLAEFSRIEALLFNRSLDNRFRRTFQGAGKFYLQALQNAEHDSEVAYLHLITAGEILANSQHHNKDDLLDDNAKELLALIETGMPDGSKISNAIRNRLLQVKRRFVASICHFVDDSFFSRSESSQGYGRFKSQTFRSSIDAAYDLRSRYVHTGVPFGRWVSLRTGGINNEVQLGKPVVEDKELGNLLALAPTYIGLERVIRYCLLRFAQENCIPIEPVKEKANQA